MNVAFPSNPPPWGGPFLSPTVVSNINYLTGGTNQMASLSSSVIVTAPSVLYVTGPISINGYIQINSNASLTIIMGGSASFGGSGIINGTGVPENLNLVGLNSCTNVSYTGGVDFVGTINAPEADMSLGGNANVYGAAIVNSFSNKGTASFHFDSCLDETEVIEMSSWKEIF
jgi:hypothetical protein